MQLQQFYEMLTQHADQLSESAKQNPEIQSLKDKISKDAENLSLIFELAEVYKEK